MLRKNRVRYDELASGQLVGEYDQAGTMIQEIVWLDDIPVATIRTDQSGGAVGVFYIHTDHLNAPTKVTRPTDNAVIWRWDHDPYGNGTPNQDPDGNGLQLTMNLRFPGQYADQETGLNYNNARYYDPQSGRYVSSDPIGLAGGQFSTYAYVGGNPISNIDPDGLQVAVPIPPMVPPPAPPGARAPTHGPYIEQEWIENASNVVGELAKMFNRSPPPSACDEDKKKKNCQALKDSILKTCASLKGRKMFACFEAAQATYKACMED